MLPSHLEQFLNDSLGPFRQMPLPGGDINQAMRLESARGHYFLKFHNRPPEQMFQREAEGLEAIAGINPGLVPTVEAVHPQGLVLEWLDLGPGPVGGACGRALAEVHRSPAPRWGGQADNFLGTLRQRQPACTSWAELYGEYRLLPLAPGCPPTLRSAIERLIPRLGELLDDRDPPSHLHGDLWAGNAGQRRNGRPVLYDPAYATGHRELDLAMSLLFGGFSPSFYSEYEACFALQPGWRDRVRLHQLYFVLAHFKLFGSPYDVQAFELASHYL